jgi:hypothetical protein
MMKVPFVDLKAQYLSMQGEIDAAISDVISKTAFIGGKPIKDFEDSFAELYGIEHCISVANGTDSLYIIMKMLGIGLGDEVITVANSWISSSETISQTGAKPVFVDIDPSYYSLNEQLLEAAISQKTKAIIPVHLHGQSVNMDEVMRIASKYKLHVIEDCAQSHFSEFKGKRVGTFGIAASFSFYPGKNLGAYGDAGAIITNDADLAEKYLADAEYEVGTVVMVGGEAEVTASVQGARAIGVVSENPAFMMNSELEGGTYIALKGRVPVKVFGPVTKGDRLIADNNGCAMALKAVNSDTFAIALETNLDNGEKTIEALVL